jgi:hypothetical protein
VLGAEVRMWDNVRVREARVRVLEGWTALALDGAEVGELRPGIALPSLLLLRQLGVVSLPRCSSPAHAQSLEESRKFGMQTKMRCGVRVGDADRGRMCWVSRLWVYAYSRRRRASLAHPALSLPHLSWTQIGFPRAGHARLDLGMERGIHSTPPSTLYTRGRALGAR